MASGTPDNTPTKYLMPTTCSLTLTNVTHSASVAMIDLISCPSSPMTRKDVNDDCPMVVKLVALPVYRPKHGKNLLPNPTS